MYGFKHLLINNPLNDISEVPLPAIIQSKTGFFYLLNDSSNESLYKINDKEYDEAYLIDNFIPYLLLSEQAFKKVNLDFVAHPFASAKSKLILLFGIVFLIIALINGLISLLAFIGIVVSLLAYSKDLIESYTNNFSKYICIESKFTSCNKENSINKVFMPILGLAFFNFIFLFSIIKIPFESIVLYTFPIGACVLAYSIYIQAKNKKICQLCFAIILTYLIITLHLYKSL